MLERVRRFLNAKEPTPQEARWGLVVAYAAAFAVQLGFVLLVGGLLRLVASPLGGEDAVLGRILQTLALALLPLGLVSATLSARRGGKGPALSAALFLGGLLAAPAWFVLLLLMAGSGLHYPLRLGLLLLLYFPLGALAALAYAGFVVRPGKPA